jgi:hypothetical protein
VAEARSTTETVRDTKPSTKARRPVAVDHEALAAPCTPAARDPGFCRSTRVIEEPPVTDRRVDRRDAVRVDVEPHDDVAVLMQIHGLAAVGRPRPIPVGCVWKRVGSRPGVLAEPRSRLSGARWWITFERSGLTTSVSVSGGRSTEARPLRVAVEGERAVGRGPVLTT